MNHAMSLCYVADIRNVIAGTVNWHVNNFCLGGMWRCKTLFQEKEWETQRKETKGGGKERLRKMSWFSMLSWFTSLPRQNLMNCHFQEQK
jgi:hypothetical protein